ncbi:hypothetical protein LTR65_002506 [Meristemomyces frigidus]
MLVSSDISMDMQNTEQVVGFSAEQLEQAVQAYYDDRNEQVQQPELEPEPRGDLVSYEAPLIATTTVDNRLIDTVWDSLAKHPDIDSRSIERVVSSKAAKNEFQTTSDVPTEAAPTEPQHVENRILATEARMWQAIAGHGVDHKRVSKFHFGCLSVIAAHGPAGILQARVVKLTGQQKQSVPMRTDVLAQRGYITKRTVLAGGSNTSLLKLKQFEDANTMAGAGRPPEAILQDAAGSVIIDYEIWFDETIRLLKQQPNQLLVLQDLRLGLGIHKKKYETRCLMRCLRRMAHAGCFRKCSAQVASADGVMSSYTKLRCVQLMREPTATDRRSWMQRDKSVRYKNSGIIDEESDDGDEDGNEDEEEEDVDGAAEEDEGCAVVSADDGEGGDDGVDLHTAKQARRPHAGRHNPNRSTARVLANPRISSEKDQEEFKAWAKATAERLVKAAELRDAQTESSEMNETRAESGEPARKRRRVSSHASRDGAALPNGQGVVAGVAEVEADILSKSRPGIYINPPGARDLKAQWYTSWGRPRKAVIAVVKTERLKELAFFTDHGGVDANMQDVHDAELEPDSTPLSQRVRTKSLSADEHTHDGLSQTPADISANEQATPGLEAQQPDQPSLNPEQLTSAAEEPASGVQDGRGLAKTPCKDHSKPHLHVPQAVSLTQPPHRRVDEDTQTYTRHYIDAHPGEQFYHVGGGRWRLGAPPTNGQGSSLHLWKPISAKAPSVVQTRVQEVSTPVQQQAHQEQQQQTTPKSINTIGQDASVVETFRKDYVDAHPDEAFYHSGHGCWKRGRRPSKKRPTLTSVTPPGVPVLDQQQHNPINNTVSTEHDSVIAETFTKAHVDTHPGETYYHCGNDTWKRGQGPDGRPSTAAVVDTPGVEHGKPILSPTSGPGHGAVMEETFRKDYVEAHPDETFYHSGHGTWRRGERPRKRRLTTSIAENGEPTELPTVPPSTTAQPPGTSTAPESVEEHGSAPSLARLLSDTHSQAPVLPPAISPATAAEVTSAGEVSTYDAAYVKARKSEVFHHVGGGWWRRGPKPEQSSAQSTGPQPHPAGVATATVNAATSATPQQFLPKKRGRPTKAMVAERERLQRETPDGVKRSLIVKLRVPGLGSAALPLANPPACSGEEKHTGEAPIITSGPTGFITTDHAVEHGGYILQQADHVQEAPITEMPDHSEAHRLSSVAKPVVKPPTAIPAGTTSAAQPRPQLPFALAIVRPYYGGAEPVTPNKSGLEQARVTNEVVESGTHEQEAISARDPQRRALTDTEMPDAEVLDTGTPKSTAFNVLQTSAFSPRGNKRQSKSDMKRKTQTDERGKVPHQRTSVILDVLEQCGGVFPGNKEMMYPFMTAWVKIYKQTPDRRTIDVAVKGLVDTGKLRKLTFSFRTKKGLNATNGILTLPSIDSSSVLVAELKEAMIEAHPLPYLPPEVDVSEDLRPKNANFPVPQGRQNSSDTWVLPDGTVTTAPHKHYTRDEFPAVEDLTVQRTTDAIRLKDKEAQALGFEDARSRAAEMGKASVKRRYYKLKQQREQEGDQGGSDDDYIGGDTPQRGTLQRKGRAVDAHGQPSQTRPQSKTPVRLTQSAKDSRQAASALKSSLKRLGQSFHSPSGTFGTNGVWPSRLSKKALNVHKTLQSEPTPCSLSKGSHVDPNGLPDMAQSFGETPKKASRFGRTLTNTSRPLDNQFVGMEQAGFWETGTAADDGNLLSKPASPSADHTDTLHADDAEVSLSKREQKERSRVDTFDKAYVQAHPREVFHHVGRARYRRGPPPPRAPKLRLPSPHTTPNMTPRVIPVYGAADPAPASAEGQLFYPGNAPLQALIAPTPTVGFGQTEQLFPPFQALAQPLESATKLKRKYKSRKRKADTEGDDHAASSGLDPQPEARTKHSKQLKSAEVDDLVAALALVKTLCGGVVQGRLNWELVSHTLSFKHDTEGLASVWKCHARQRSRDVDSLQAAIREPFLAAYERGELPRIDFQDLGKTEWPALLSWWKTQELRPLLSSREKVSPGLPDSMAALHDQFAVAEPKGRLQPDHDAYFTANTDDTRDTAALRLNHGSTLTVQERPIEEDLTLIKSWCRAIALTQGDRYSTGEAAAKIGIFGNALIQEATEELLACRILTVERRERQLPGRNYYLSNATLKQFRRWPDKEGPFLRDVAAAHISLLTHFQYNDTFELGCHARDSEILVLTNMVAQGQLKVKTVLPERNDDFDAPFPKLSAWGVGDADNFYNLHEYDPARVKFPVLYQQTAGLSAEHGLLSVPIPLSPAPVEDERGLRIPFWVDIHGNLIDDLWDMTLRSLLHLVVYRTGITAAGMEHAHDGKLWLWEIQLALAWMEQVGLATRCGPGKETEGLWNGGWRAGEWWYCAFASDIATWRVPRGEMW